MDSEFHETINGTVRIDEAKRRKIWQTEQLVQHRLVVCVPDFNVRQLGEILQRRHLAAYLTLIDKQALERCHWCEFGQKTMAYFRSMKFNLEYVAIDL